MEAGRAGLPVEVDFSRQSEAVYVRVKRDCFWYGLRIASHEPHHVCSADCEQFLVPQEVASVAELAATESRLKQAVVAGGQVVAGGGEVAAALLEEVRRQRDRQRQSGESGTLWQWEEQKLAWRLIRVEGREPLPADHDVHAGNRPNAPPEIRLTPSEQCAIRHRLNFRAAWAREEQLAWSTAVRVASAGEGGPNA